MIDHDTDNNLLDVNKKNISVFCGIIAFCKDQFSWIVGFLCIRGDQISWIHRFTVLKGKLNLLNSVFVKNVKFLFTGYT